MKAVILAGGKGSRLAPYTAVLPKPLMPIVDMPILEIVLKQLKSHGFDQIVIAVGHLASLIKAYFGDGSDLGISIEYVIEASPLGTAGPLGNIDVMEPAVSKHIKRGQYLDLPDLVKLLLTSGERVRAYPFEGRWLDIGRQEDFAEAQAQFEEHRDHFLK